MAAMSSPEYLQLARLHADLVAKLVQVTSERDDLLRQLRGSSMGIGEPGKRQRGTSFGSLKWEPTVVVESDLVMSHMYYNPAVFKALHDLFWALDTHNQGEITPQSFQTGQFVSFFAQTMGGNWETLRVHFDRDNSGTIDPIEFCDGFLRWALDKPLLTNVPSGTTLTLSECHSRVAEEVNKQVQQVINHFSAQVANVVAAKDVTRPAPISSRQPTDSIYVFRLPSMAVQRMSAIFAALDKTRTGSITTTDFEFMGAHLGTWENVRRFFDRDGDGKVTQKEFLDGFKGWAMAQTLTLPGCTTLREIILQIDATTEKLLLQNALPTLEAQLLAGGVRR